MSIDQLSMQPGRGLNISAQLFGNQPSITVDRNGGLFSHSLGRRGLTLLLVATIGRQTVPSLDTRSNSPSPVRMTDQVATVRRGDVRMVNKYRVLGQVGKGRHGEVWLCEDTRDNDKQFVCYMSPVPRPPVLTFLPL